MRNILNIFEVHFCTSGRNHRYEYFSSHNIPKTAQSSNDELVRMEKIGLIESLSANMPTQLRIDTSTIPGQNLGVFSSAWIKQGTKMGPFTGRLVTTDEQLKHDSKFVWEVREHPLTFYKFNPIYSTKLNLVHN